MIQFFSFSALKYDVPQIVMLGRQYWSKSRPVFDELRDNATFENCSTRIAGIDKLIDDLIGVKNYVSKNDARAMGCNELLSDKVDRFSDKASLDIANYGQDYGEHRDHDSRNRGEIAGSITQLRTA